jgi:hypothetical protein
MTKQELAATLNVAYAVAGVDGFADEEKDQLAKELASYNLSEEDNNLIIQAYNEMSILEAVNIIAQANEDVKKEASALIIYAIIADRNATEMETGAHRLMVKLLDLPLIEFEEAQRILGF